MLQSKPSEGRKLETYGFIVAVEAEGEINPEYVANKLIEGAMWIEGIGRVCADFLGKLDVYPDEVPDAINCEKQPRFPFEEKEV